MVDSAKETGHERLVKKHLPAWVISGAVNVGIVAILLIFGNTSLNTRASEKVVNADVDQGEESPVDLSNDTEGLQSNLTLAFPEIKKMADQAVEEAETQDPLGHPDKMDTTDSAHKPPGLSADSLVPGMNGDRGTFMGGGGEGGQFPAEFAGRGGANKSDAILKWGGNRDSELAVARGLAWLARQQRPDGSWVFDGEDKQHVIASTGMAVLPFLAAGFTHKNDSIYKRVVASALNFLTKNCPSGANAGMMSTNMYAQAIGTLALCEAYGMTKDRGLLLASAQAAINYIVRAQGPNGSWGYSAGAAGDTSIVGWQIQALQAARLSKDIVVPDATIKKAIAFLDLAAAGSRKSAYGYNNNTGATPGTSLTAVGLLCRYYIDKWGPDHPGLADGVQGLMKRSPGVGAARPTLDMYYYYYATQVVHFFEGDDWKNWNEGSKQADGTRKGGMRDWLIELQSKKPGANHGSWEPDTGFIGRSCGRLGTTALSILTLEVYYRHLPLYKRGNNGNAGL
jgi:hypothetical protein